MTQIGKCKEFARLTPHRLKSQPTGLQASLKLLVQEGSQWTYTYSLLSDNNILFTPLLPFFKNPSWSLPDCIRPPYYTDHCKLSHISEETRQKREGPKRPKAFSFTILIFSPTLHSKTSSYNTAYNVKTSLNFSSLRKSVSNLTFGNFTEC